MNQLSRIFCVLAVLASVGCGETETETSELYKTVGEEVVLPGDRTLLGEAHIADFRERRLCYDIHAEELVGRAYLRFYRLGELVYEADISKERVSDCVEVDREGTYRVVAVRPGGDSDSGEPGRVTFRIEAEAYHSTSDLRDSLVILGIALSLLLFMLWITRQGNIDRVAALSPPGWVRPALANTALVSIFLLIIDEGGLLLAELGFDESFLLFDWLRYLMGLNGVSQGLYVASLVLMFDFVDGMLSSHPEYQRRPDNRLRVALVCLNLMLLLEVVFYFIWYRPSTMGINGIVWGGIVSAAVVTLLATFVRLDFTRHLDAARTADEEAAYRSGTTKVLLLAIFFPMAETFITKILFLVMVYDRTRKLYARMTRGAVSSEESDWAALVAGKSSRTFLANFQFALMFSLFLPLLCLWRATLSPFPPTDSAFVYPISVSVVFMLPICYSLFVVKLSRVSWLHALMMVALTVGAFYLVPFHIAPSLFEVTSESMIGGILLNLHNSGRGLVLYLQLLPLAIAGLITTFLTLMLTVEDRPAHPKNGKYIIGLSLLSGCIHIFLVPAPVALWTQPSTIEMMKLGQGGVMPLTLAGMAFLALVFIGFHVAGIATFRSGMVVLFGKWRDHLKRGARPEVLDSVLKAFPFMADIPEDRQRRKKQAGKLRLGKLAVLHHSLSLGLPMLSVIAGAAIVAVALLAGPTDWLLYVREGIAAREPLVHEGLLVTWNTSSIQGVDMESGEVAWGVSPGSGVGFRTRLVYDDQVVFHGEHEVLCILLADGSYRWRTEIPAKVNVLLRPAPDVIVAAGSDSVRTLEVQDGAVRSSARCPLSQGDELIEGASFPDGSILLASEDGHLFNYGGGAKCTPLGTIDGDLPVKLIPFGDTLVLFAVERKDPEQVLHAYKITSDGRLHTLTKGTPRVRVNVGHYHVHEDLLVSISGDYDGGSFLTAAYRLPDLTPVWELPVGRFSNLQWFPLERGILATFVAPGKWGLVDAKSGQVMNSGPLPEGLAAQDLWAMSLGRSHLYLSSPEGLYGVDLTSGETVLTFRPPQGAEGGVKQMLWGPAMEVGGRLYYRTQISVGRLAWHPVLSEP
jgi:hypothetical protein